MKKTKKVIKKKPKIEKILKKIPKETEKVPTGITNFDRLIEGGFEKYSTNLVVGGSGSGKSIFAIQFLMEGIKKGEKCLYVTFEEKKKEAYKNMLDFSWDLEQLEKQGKFIFLEYTPEKVKIMLEEGGGTIESLVLREKITRVVIDSITSFELLFDKEIEKREAALSLFNMLRKWDITALLTYERDPSIEKKASTSSKALEFESDSIILIYFSRTNRKRERYIEVLKMRGTKHAREIYPFSIEKSGIIIGTESYAGKIKT